MQPRACITSTRLPAGNGCHPPLTKPPGTHEAPRLPRSRAARWHCLLASAGPRPSCQAKVRRGVDLGAAPQLLAVFSPASVDGSPRPPLAGTSTVLGLSVQPLWQPAPQPCLEGLLSRAQVVLDETALTSAASQIPTVFPPSDVCVLCLEGSPAPDTVFGPCGHRRVPSIPSSRRRHRTRTAAERPRPPATGVGKRA